MTTRTIAVASISLGVALLAAVMTPAGAQYQPVLAPNGQLYAYNLWQTYRTGGSTMFGPGLARMMVGSPLTRSYLRSDIAVSAFRPGPAYAPQPLNPNSLTPVYLDPLAYQNRAGLQLVPQRGSLSLANMLFRRQGLYYGNYGY